MRHVLFVCNHNAGRSQIAQAFFDRQEKPTKLTTEMQLHADWAVTMGCGDACPFVPAMVQEWDVEDPSTLPIERVREIRDQIEQHVKDLLTNHLQDIYLDRTAHQLRLERLLPAVREDLGDRFSEQQIRACSDQVLAGYDDATVRGHVMTIAHRDVTECLTAGNCA